MSDPIDPLASYLYKEKADLSEKVKQVHTREDEKKLASARKMLKFLDRVPEKYKSGPWSPVAYLVLFSYAAFLLWMFKSAVQAYRPLDYTNSGRDERLLNRFRLLAGLYGVFNTVLTVRAVGWWPFTSYTLTSWNLMTVRLLSASLSSQGFRQFSFLADVTRFPALVGCTVTVVVWWMILVPLIHFLLRKDPTERKFFWNFNFSFTLTNLHLLNLPIIAVDFLYSHQPLNFFDLYIGLLVAFVYALFYLKVLDPLGLHFYIVLTPRSKLCILAYGFILGGYYLIYLFWNRWV